MSSSPISPLRPVLENRTNLFHTPLQPKSFFSKPSPPEDRKVRRRAAILDDRPKLKRVRLDLEDDGSNDPYESDDTDVEMEDVAVARAWFRKEAPFQRNILSVMRRPGNLSQPDSVYLS